MKSSGSSIAFLYEHPQWSEKLINTFHAKNVDLTLINLADLKFNSDRDLPEFKTAVNRINIMPSEKRNPSVAFHTLHYLTWLETMGVRIINGSRAHFVGASKAVQNGLFAKAGLHCPTAVAVHKVADIPSAAELIGYPLIVKPNIGGSGSGISKYESKEFLMAAIDADSIDLGIDGTGLVQTYIRSDGHVYRVEVLGDALFYSIRQKMIENTFNYCAADGCAVSAKPDPLQEPDKDKKDYDFCAIGGNSRIQAFEPDPEIIEQVVSIVKMAGADLGGVEYLLDVETGQPCFYDFNPYSNFVSNGEELFGFSPDEKFVEFVLSRC